MPQNKKMEKWPILDYHQGQNALEKFQFFDFLNFLFLYLRNAFYLSSITVKLIFLAYIAWNKKMEKWPI